MGAAKRTLVFTFWKVGMKSGSTVHSGTAREVMEVQYGVRGRDDG